MKPATPQARAAATYNAAADHYDDPALAFWDRAGRRTVERVAPPPGARVLDVCCGSGASALPAAAAVGPGGSVLGIDLAERLLDLARTKAAAAGLANVHFQVGDLETLEGVDGAFDPSAVHGAFDPSAVHGAFDVVQCVFGIFFVPDMAAAARRLWGRVAPGGALALTTWGPRLFEPASTLFWDAVRAADPALYKAFNPWDRIADPGGLRALFDEAGIPGVEIEPETAAQTLRSPDDAWSIALGSGFRGTLDQLSPAARDQVRAAWVDALRRDRVTEVETNVLYAHARRR